MAVDDIGAVAIGPSGAALIPLIADGKYLLYIVGLLISYAAGFLITRFWGFNESMVARLDRGLDHGDNSARSESPG
jgi:PTS system sucrose-specific IIC component